MAKRTWGTEFRSGYDIPDFILFLARKGLIEDTSWHNDVSPSFGVEGIVKGTRERPEGYGTREIRLFIDDPIKSRREYQGKRFAVTFMDSGGDFDSWEFDELEEALERLIEEIMKHLPDLEELPKAWEEYREAELLPSEILWELMKDYRERK